MLQIQSLSFSYSEKKVLNDFSMEVQTGEIVALMGPSGCGKSTLLQLIAGLLKPDAGQIRCDAETISYVFQEPRLFPWLTVKENLALILNNKEDAQKIQPLLSALGLEGIEDMKPDQLSGGMKSRVSLARAMLYGGDLFLLDEPFSALDEDRIEQLLPLLKEMLRASGATALLVTHRASEAQALADRIIDFPIS